MNTPEFINELMENQPEYSEGSPLQCRKWDYKRCLYEFYDTEEGLNHVVNMKALLKGFELLKRDLLSGKIKLSIGIVIYDAGNWDAEAVDALVQYAIFGKAVYG
jgi:hypothetical protein